MFLFFRQNLQQVIVLNSKLTAFIRFTLTSDMLNFSKIRK